MLDRNFNPGFRINLHIKDLANALDTGHEVGAPLLLTASVMEILQALRMDGLGDCDHGALVRYFEKQAKIELNRCPAGRATARAILLPTPSLRRGWGRGC